MLAADKTLLQTTVLQRAIQLREKELNLFNDKCAKPPAGSGPTALTGCVCRRHSFNAVGTQSAVLAGFAMTSFAEIDLPHNAFYAQKARTPALLRSPSISQLSPLCADSQACLHLFVTISICANLMCTASTTFVSVWGSGKALRGKVCPAAATPPKQRAAAHSPPAPVASAGRVYEPGRGWHE